LSDGSFKEEIYLYQGGIKEYVQYMNAAKESIHPEIIYVDSQKENVYVEAAMQWCSDVYSDNILGFANNIRTIDGGTHIEGLKTVLTRTFNNLAKKRGKRKDIEKNLAGVNRPIQIIPSVLPADWANMGACVKELEEAGVDRIQFDVMDGNFVPNLTFGPEMIAACRKYCNVPFETQLMVSQYNCETMLESYVKATKGANGEPGVVIAHAEANIHLHRILGRIRDLGGSPSVALNPHTPFEMIKNIMDMVDHVLVMTVNPGFGGQAYIPTMLNKIREIRNFIIEKNLNVDIEVDGGIKANWTISQCADAGANCFIAGSGMFAYPTLKEGCDDLRKVAQEAQKGNVLSEPQ